jgi:hypothetical protein
MHRIALLLTLAFVAHQAHADTTLCQSINGRTTCTHATGNVRCTSINGDTRCVPVDADHMADSPALPEISLPGVDIRTSKGRLHVQAGETEVDVPVAGFTAEQE